MSAMLREPGLLKQLKDMAETHARELREYEATVANLSERIRQMEVERVPANFGHAAIQDAIGALEIADHVADPAHASEDDYRAFQDAIDGLNELLAAAPAQEKV